MPLDFKSKHVSQLSYGGYIASGEEITAQEKDYSEIFTVTKDLSLNDVHVQMKIPCHGPMPWPDSDYKTSMKTYMDELGLVGEKLLKLVGLSQISLLAHSGEPPFFLRN